MVDHVGQQFGNYRLLRLLGQGGFAEVYLGKHVYLNNLAAIKLLHAHLVGKDAEHFLAEAKTLVDLMHPNIVRVLDFAVRDGSPFLIMDYIVGGTLRQQHPEGSRVPLDLVVLYIKQVASALQYAHDRELIHRDVKPENMLLGKHQEVILSDFGIATVVPRSGPLAKKEVVGTPAYMAPEQIDGRPHIASDQYALGLVAYEWLCGELPFRGSIFHIMNQHKNRPVPPLRDKNSAISHEVEKVVLKALAKDVAQRYDSVLAFAEALEHAHQQEVARTVPLHFTIVTPDPPFTRIADFLTGGIKPLQQLVSRRKVMMALGGVVLAGGVAGGAWFWNASHSAQRPVARIYRGHSRGIKAVAWAPDGKRLASGGEDNTVQVWDALTLKTLFTYRGHSDHVNAVGWSPDGTFLSSAAQDGTVQVWGAVNGAIDFPAADQAAITLDCSLDGKYIVSGYDEIIQLLDATSGAIVAVFTQHVDTVLTTAFSPDSTLVASGSVDGAMYVWDVATAEVQMLYTKKSALQSVAWSFDGKLALGYQDGSITLVDATAKHAIFSSPTTSQAVQSLLWSPDNNHLVALDAGGAISLWDVAQGKLHLRSKYTAYTSNSVAWSPDSARIVLGGNNNSIQIWDVATEKAFITYDSAISPVQAIAWSPDGAYIASGGGGYELRIINANNGDAVLTCSGPFNAIKIINWLHDSKRIVATGDDNNVYLWDAARGGAPINIYGKSGPVHTAVWSPHGNYLALGDQQLARVKKVNTATITTAYLDSSKPVLAVSWSPDSQYIATGGESQKVHIWSAPTNENVAVYNHLKAVNAVAWSPQSKMLASASDDKSVQVWDLATQNVIFTYLDHAAAVNAIAWSPDGKYIASGSSDMTVRVWSATTGKLVFTYQGHTGQVNAVAWSPDGKHIASGSSDMTVHIWEIDLKL